MREGVFCENERKAGRGGEPLAGDHVRDAEGGALAFLTAVAILFLCALAVSNRWLGQGMMDSAVMAACALGALAGGLLAVRQGRGRSLLMGFGAGLILFLLLLTAGFLFYESADLRNGGLGLLLSCGCGGAWRAYWGKPKKNAEDD